MRPNASINCQPVEISSAELASRVLKRTRETPSTSLATTNTGFGAKLAYVLRPIPRSQQTIAHVFCVMSGRFDEAGTSLHYTAVIAMGRSRPVDTQSNHRLRRHAAARVCKVRWRVQDLQCER